MSLASITRLPQRTPIVRRSSPLGADDEGAGASATNGTDGVDYHMSNTASRVSLRLFGAVAVTGLGATCVMSPAMATTDSGDGPNGTPGPMTAQSTVRPDLAVSSDGEHAKPTLRAAARLKLIAPVKAPATKATRNAEAKKTETAAAAKRANDALAAAKKKLVAANAKVAAAKKTKTKSDDKTAAAAKKAAVNAVNAASTKAAAANHAAAVAAAAAKKASAQAARTYTLNRRALTASNIENFGNKLALTNYSVNPGYYVPSAVKSDTEGTIGGIRLVAGAYGSTAGVNVVEGSCSTTWVSPKVVAHVNQSTNRTLAYNALRRYGYSNNSASALVSVLDSKSAMNPNKTSGGFGIAGWANAAPLKAAAKASDSPQYGLSFQLAYIIRGVNASTAMTSVAKSTASAASLATKWGKWLNIAAPAKVTKAATDRAKANIKYTYVLKSLTSCASAAGNAYATKYEQLLGATTLVGWYDGKKYSVGHMCQKNSQSVWKMVGGTNVYDGIYGNAVDVGFYMLNAGKMRPWTGYVPRGAVVWWDYNIGGGYGHAAVADGKGNFINNFGGNSIVRTAFKNVSVKPMGWVPVEEAYGPMKKK